MIYGYVEPTPYLVMGEADNIHITLVVLLIKFQKLSNMGFMHMTDLICCYITAREKASAEVQLKESSILRLQRNIIQ